MTLYRVKPDIETKRFNHQVRLTARKKGQPAVFPVSLLNSWPTTTRFLFSPKWQTYQINAMAVSKYGKLFNDLKITQKTFIIRAFKGATGPKAALHNNAGTNPNINKSGKVTLAGKPRQESLIFALNVYEGLEVRENSKGVEMVRLWSFIASNNPPPLSLSILDDPRIQYGTTQKPNGSIGNFPHLKGPRVPFIFLTSEPMWYPRHELDVVE